MKSSGVPWKGTRKWRNLPSGTTSVAAAAGVTYALAALMMHGSELLSVSHVWQQLIEPMQQIKHTSQIGTKITVTKPTIGPSKTSVKPKFTPSKTTHKEFLD
jgi:tetrahydromethanopterin S-methyltransferase subunit D